MTTKKFDALIIDLDGTMVDTLGDFTAAINAMLRDLQYESVSSETVKQYIGKGSEHLVRSILALQAATTKTTHTLGEGYVQMAALNAYLKHYRKINGQYSQIFSGVSEGLSAFKAQGLHMACLTNKPLAFAQELLNKEGLSDYFDVVFGGDSFERKKPDPFPVIKSCEALGTTPDRTLMIGDSSNDAHAADAAGCAVVLVNYGYNHGQDIALTRALAHVSSFNEIASKFFS